MKDIISEIGEILQRVKMLLHSGCVQGLVNNNSAIGNGIVYPFAFYILALLFLLQLLIGCGHFFQTVIQ